MNEKSPEDMEQRIARTLDNAIIKLTDLHTEQFRTVQESLVLLQRQIDVLNERVADNTAKLLQHIASHKASRERTR